MLPKAVLLLAAVSSSAMCQSLARKERTVRPYLELANLSNTGYEEIPGVVMPSRSIVAGMELVLTHESH